MAIKALVLDRDGTLNVEGPTEGGYVTKPEDLKLYDGVADVLAGLRRRGVGLYVFTQQSCIAKGLLTEDGLASIHTHMQTLLGQGYVDGFYHCPHGAADACHCRKPMPGMLVDIMQQHRLKGSEVAVIGDSLRDWQAAHAIGVPFAFVRTGKGAMLEASAVAPQASFFDTLAEAVDFFLPEGEKKS